MSCVHIDFFSNESDLELLAPNSPISLNYGNLWVPSESVTLLPTGIIPNRALVTMNWSPSPQTLRSLCPRVFHFQRTRQYSKWVHETATSKNHVRKKVLFYERMGKLAQRQSYIFSLYLVIGDVYGGMIPLRDLDKPYKDTEGINKR